MCSSCRHTVDIQDAYKLLSPTLGAKAASVIFALALLASGQNSTITGTLAGQVVMEVGGRGYWCSAVRPTVSVSTACVHEVPLCMLACVAPLASANGLARSGMHTLVRAPGLHQCLPAY